MSYFKNKSENYFSCDESLYHSALEQPEDDDEEENYYTHLHESRMESSANYYSSLQFHLKKNESLFKQKSQKSPADTSNDYLIAKMMQLDEVERVKSKPQRICEPPEPTETITNFEFSTYLDNVENKTLDTLYSKIKTNKSKFVSLDDTIEEAFDESHFEQKLEEFIRRTARQHCNAGGGRVGGGGGVNNFFVNVCACQHKVSQTDSSKKPMQQTLGNSYYTPQKVEATNRCSSHLIQSSVEFNCLKCDDEKYGKTSINKNKGVPPPSTEEMNFLDHALSLIKFSMLDELYEKFKEATGVFFDKMTELIRSTNNSVIKSVANVFLGLVNADFSHLIKSYKELPEKWNVLKNMVYFAFKFTLFHISKMFDSNALHTFENILTSIFNYVKNFNYIIY
jgi:hypothetical protein